LRWVLSFDCKIKIGFSFCNLLCLYKISLLFIDLTFTIWGIGLIK
jgi:hypothetical protein